jgi:type VI secretion system protein VasJ
VAESAALATLGTTPIPGAAPAGASARYEPEFEQLAAEIAKLESVEGKTTLKWPSVVELSSTLLGSKSKDLLVASYMTLGLYRTKGYAGLRDGLTVCRDLLNTFWDGLFPEKTRMRARTQAMEWLSERLSAALLEGRPPSKSDKDALEGSASVMQELKTLAGSKFEENQPSLGDLERAIDDKVSAIPADAPPPAPEEAAPAEAAPEGGSADASAEAPGPAVSTDTPENARASLQGLRDARTQVAAVLRAASALDPLPYRLLRLAVWEEMVDAPRSNSGVLEFGAVDAAFAQQLEDQLSKGEYLPVIEQAETRLLSDALWLDLNFFTVRAMEGLGRPYAAARKTVTDCLAGLIRTAPGLLELKFADGQPLASDATKVWIQDEAAAGSAPAAVSGLDAAIAEARKLLARKQFNEAAGLVLKELQRVSDRRSRFVIRLQLARLCQEGGKADLALPQLEALDEEARRLGLDEWEPALAGELAQQLWKAHGASATPEKAREHYVRLCRLNPAAALGTDGRK